MMGNDAMTVDAERQLVLRREIPFARENVWKALTDPVHVSKWWGPDGFTSEGVRQDFRVGGIWAFDLLGPDGARYPNHLMYKEIVPPSKLAFAHGDGKRAWFETAITLAEAAGGMLITLCQHYETKALRDEVVGKYRAVEIAKQHLAKLETYIREHLAR
jgi:uncharacterized protein YndB with AHSA1/START domain